MKKWISLLLCGTLVLSSFLAVGTTYNNQTPIQTSKNEYVPVIFDIGIDIGSDGNYECQFYDRETPVNNWTGRFQNVSVNITIENPWNNTGSHRVWWRIAEFPIAGPLAFITFLISHGRAEPVINQVFLTPYTISWKAADNETTFIPWTIPIKLAYTETFEFDILVGDSIFHYDWGQVNYEGTGNI
jgi:hypothetical protein